METVHAVISEAFSNAVIIPRETTTDDVIWWMRQRVQELGYQVWFQPSLDMTRQGADRGRTLSSSCRPQGQSQSGAAKRRTAGREEEAYLDADGERHWVFRRQQGFHLVWRLG